MRRALMRVSFAALQDLLRGRWSADCVGTTAPSDLRVVGVEHGPAFYSHGWFYAVLESDDFEDIEPGDLLPELEPFKYEVLQ